MPPTPHRDQKLEQVACAAITVSDTRRLDNDISGNLVVQRLTDAGHIVLVRDILKDEPAAVRERVRALANDASCQAVLLNGGTGVAARDTTIEAVEGLLDRRLDGFGELFRMLSHRQVGAAAMLSRAMAGLCGRTVVFAMPGSPKAVELALDSLILPELGHLAWLAADS